MKLPFDHKKITGRFGTLSEFRKKNGMQPHSGVDFAVPVGTPIPALANGTITIQQFSKVLGNVTELRIMAYDPAGDGSEKEIFYIGYSHNKAEGVAVGTKVKEGDTICFSGNSGSASSGPHSHITVSKQHKGLFGPTAVKQDLIEFVKFNQAMDKRDKAKK